MNDAQYFADPAVSNSKLGMIDPTDGGSPLGYKSYHDNNFEQKNTLSLDRGKLLHLFMLEPEKYHVLTVPKPTAGLGLFVDAFIEQLDTPSPVVGELASIDDVSADYFETIADGLGYEDSEANAAMLVNAVRQARIKSDYSLTYKEPTILKNIVEKGLAYIVDACNEANKHKQGVTQVDADTIKACSKSINSHPLAPKLLNPSDVWIEQYNELTVMWTVKIEVEGEMIEVDCKAKLDKMLVQIEKKILDINDIKTTGFKVSKFGRESFIRFRYYRQAAFYTRAAFAWLKQNGHNPNEWTVNFNNIVVETKGLFECKVYRAPDYWIKRGTNEYRDLMHRTAWHMKHNAWTYDMEDTLNGYITDIPLPEGIAA